MNYLQVIDYYTLPVGNTVAEGRRALIRNMWTDRIKGVKRNVEVLFEESIHTVIGLILCMFHHLHE